MAQLALWPSAVAVPWAADVWHSFGRHHPSSLPSRYCRRALRGVVARAQAANDERLLASPYLQLKAMLGLGSVHLDAL